MHSWVYVYIYIYTLWHYATMIGPRPALCIYIVAVKRETTMSQYLYTNKISYIDFGTTLPLKMKHELA